MHRFTEKSAAPVRPILTVGDTVDISAIMHFAGLAADKAAREQNIPTGERQTFCEEYIARVEATVRGLDVRKFRMLEDVFLYGGSARNHVKAEFLHPDGRALESADVIVQDGNTYDLADSLSAVAELPINGFLAPELGRYYFERKSDGADRARRSLEFARNKNAEKEYLSYRTATRTGSGIVDLYERFSAEDEKIKLLERKEEILAKELFAAEEKTRNAHGKSAFTRWRLGRRERTAMRKFASAQKNTNKYINSLKKQLEKQVSAGRINEYAFNKRRDQLEKRDFTYTVMPEELHATAIGQRTYEEAILGRGAVSYAELSAEERINRDLGMIRARENSLDAFIESRAALLREGGQMSVAELKAFEREVRERTVSLNDEKRALAARERDRTMAIAKRMPEKAQSDGLNYKLVLAYGEVLEQEMKEANDFYKLRSELYDRQDALAGFNALRKIGRETDVYSPEEVETLAAENERLREAAESLESYKTALTRAYESYAATGLRSAEYVESKKASIARDGFSGFVCAVTEPIDRTAYQQAIAERDAREAREREDFLDAVMSSTRRRAPEGVREAEADDAEPEREAQNEEPEESLVDEDPDIFVW